MPRRERPRPRSLIAESDLNDPRTVPPAAQRRAGASTPQWADDFHHALHALLTGERDGYYADFGRVADLAEASARPFVYDGRYSAHRRRRHGAPADDLPPRRFVVCSQNHDQVGNRAIGDRPAAPTRALAAMWVILSPYVPLLFMGEEHGEERPFQFFTDHIDPFIATATREGRRREFAAFAGFAGEEVPDPQDPETRGRSVIDPARRRPGDARALPGACSRCAASCRTRSPACATTRPAAGSASRGARSRWWATSDADDAEVPVEARRAWCWRRTPGVALSGGRLRLPPLAGAVVR